MKLPPRSGEYQDIMASYASASRAFAVNGITMPGNEWPSRMVPPSIQAPPGPDHPSGSWNLIAQFPFLCSLNPLPGFSRKYWPHELQLGVTALLRIRAVLRDA